MLVNWLVYRQTVCTTSVRSRHAAERFTLFGGRNLSPEDWADCGGHHPGARYPDPVQYDYLLRRQPVRFYHGSRWGSGNCRQSIRLLDNFRLLHSVP